MSFIFDILTSAIQYGLIWCLLALGVFISFRVLDFADLSIEGTFPLGAMVVAVLIFFGVNPIIATIIAMFAGFIAGAITGILHTILKIPSIIAGIVTMSGLYSINLSLGGLTKEFSGGANTISIDYRNTIFYNMISKVKVTLIDKWGWDFISTTNSSRIATSIIVLFFVIIIFGFTYWFFGTELGMSIRSTGDSPKMSRAQGINTSLMIIIGLALSNGFIALSGAIAAQSSSSADVTMGSGAIVVGVAAIIIGDMIMGKKRRTFKKSLISVILGTIIYYIIYAIATQLQVEHYLRLFVAIIIVVILALPLMKKLLSNIKRKKGKYA